MKNRIFIIAAFLLFCQGVNAQRTCGTVYDQKYINGLDSGTRDRLNKFNLQLNDPVNKNSPRINNATVSVNADEYILIPVVVHVVWNTAAQNITDAQICSQIAVLNEDFSRTNADRTNTPYSFSNVSINPRIQFYLATVDPNGFPKESQRLFF